MPLARRALTTSLDRLKLHAVLVFVSVVVGVMRFGPAGLILGPVALTVTTVLREVCPSCTASVAAFPVLGPTTAVALRGASRVMEEQDVY